MAKQTEEDTKKGFLFCFLFLLVAIKKSLYVIYIPFFFSFSQTLYILQANQQCDKLEQIYFTITNKKIMKNKGFDMK